jgi:hypothetical protein
MAVACVSCAMIVASACGDSGGATETDAATSGTSDAGTSDPGTTAGTSTGELTTSGDATTGGATTGGATTGPLSEFALTIYPDIIAPNCSCHVDGGPGGLSMPSAAVAYENLVLTAATQLGTMDRVSPGDSMESYLIHKLENTHLDVGGSGGVMPKSGALPGNVINDVRAWIDNGAM